jgi:peptide/nickel transport system ATP-binding protein
MNSPLLSIDRLHIAYPHSQDWVVEDFSLQLQPGERLGLVGESGCGKSTLGRALLNLLPPGSRTQGEVQVDGQSVLQLTPTRARRFRGEVAALVFQDPMTRLNPLLSVGDHCIETLLAHDAGLNRQQAKQRALDTLDAVKIPAARWQQFPHEFSGGMRQRVAIALALLLNPKLIVADEPTTSLDVTIAAQILGELTRLCADREMALVLISHDLAVVGEYCDRIAVMYEGKLVETGSISQVLRQPAHDYTKSLLKSALYLESGAKSSAVMFQPGVQPLLQLKQLKQHYMLESGVLGNLFTKSTDRQIRAVDGIDLEIYPGETLGLVGESGCGKSTLSRTILQLLRPTSGSVEFDGQDLGKLGRKAIQRQRRDIQMIFQDPNACLNPRMTVAESILDPLLIHKMGTIDAARAQVETVMQKVGLDPAIFSDRYPGQLSGGQQQRVAIARALITQPKLVICDEPVSMLDATVRTQVLDLMRDLKAEFKLTYLFITHDLWVARFFCDRIAVMNQGKIIELGQTDFVFNHPQQDYTKTLLGAAPMLNLRAG